MSYRIGSFNLCDFSGHSEKDVRAIADIIIREEFDIIALQEVLDPQALSRLCTYLGGDWQGRHGVPKNRSTELEFTTNRASGEQIKTPVQNTAKGYAFIWNSRRITLCAEPELFSKIKKGKLVRNPYYGRFIPINGPHCEFRLINVHLCSPAEDQAKHIQEYKTVVEEVYSRISKTTYGDNRPAYTILLGDYGMPVTQCADIEPYLRLEKQQFVADVMENTVLADAESLSAAALQYSDGKKNGIKTIAKSAGKIGLLAGSALLFGDPNAFPKKAVDFFSNEVKSIANTRRGIQQNKADMESDSFIADYDHFGYDIQRFTTNAEAVLNIERVNAVKTYYRNDFVNYRQLVSDHVPIKMEVILNGDFYGGRFQL